MTWQSPCRLVAMVVVIGLSALLAPAGEVRAYGNQARPWGAAGRWHLRARATDAAGQADPTPAQVSFRAG